MLKKYKFPVLEAISVLILAGIFSLLVLLDIPKYILVIIICLFFVLSFGLYVVAIHYPIKKLEYYISVVAKGNYPNDIKGNTPSKALSQLFNRFADFIIGHLFPMFQELKLNIIKNQENSNNFLGKVQDAITNASRISLGADYINDRMKNLEALQNATLHENTGIRSNISAYQRLVEKQGNEISSTEKILDSINESLNSKN